MDATFALTLIEAVLILLAIAISKAIRLVSSVDDSCKDADDSIPAASAPSHIIIAPPAIKYDVFLSFRGEDTRDTFSSHLYEALCDAQIQTFMDHKLHKGDHISPILLKTIEESEISLIIFSKDYASSTWCMDELVHIMKCKDQYGRLVIPIFYNVDPSNIRKQNGSFGDGFAKLKQRFERNQGRVQEWKNALIKSTSLSGWDSKNVRPESKLVKKIVKDILSKLNHKSSFHLEGLVGIDHQIQKIKKLLSEARIVGIWGMGGIGKTTLASAVFERLKGEFEAFCFVKDVRQWLARNGLDELLKKCLKELLKDENINTYNLRSDFVRRRLYRKKIILVLDDVDNFIAAKDLVEACNWFGEGSRIIVTSRDMQVLKNASAFSPYRVPSLNFDDAFRLFSLKAFRQNEPSKSYMELSKSVVNYCQGNPLALVVLGCFLYGRGKEEWESALEKLNQAPPKDIVDILKLSFDGLDDKQQNVFLDLAFLIEERVYDISLNLMTQLYGSSAHIEISVLREKSLISFVSHNDFIVMHDLVRKMGLEISRQQLFFGRKGPIRLWRHEDIDQFFHNDKGIEAIRCMSLDESKIDSITVTAKHFRKMRYLMYLKVHKSDVRKPSNLTICEDLDYLSKELRFLSWERYPQSQVPLRFCAENLIELRMPESNIRQLWDGEQHFPNLESINLNDSKHLITLPDLSCAPKIKELDLNSCENLGQIHSSTIPEKKVLVFIRNCGPMQISLGGSMKGISSGLVIVENYLDVADLSLHKVTMKVFKCGNIICGVGFKHVRVPLGEMGEMRVGMQNLASLLPFVRRVEWSESPIEFGDDFKQHRHTYDVHHHHAGPNFNNFILAVEVGKLIEDKEEKGGDDDDDSNSHQVETTTLLMEDEEDEEDDDDESNGHQVATTLLLMEDEEEEKEEEDDSESDTLLLTTTLLPNSIPRWSLLRRLRLKDSDINMIGKNAGQVSIILKSLNNALSCTRGIQPLLALQLHSPTLSLLPEIGVYYNSETMPHAFWPSSFGNQVSIVYAP